MTLKITYAVDYMLCGLELTAVVPSWEDVARLPDVTGIRKMVSVYVDGRFDGITSETIR